MNQKLKEIVERATKTLENRQALIREQQEKAQQQREQEEKEQIEECVKWLEEHIYGMIEGTILNNYDHIFFTEEQWYKICDNIDGWYHIRPSLKILVRALGRIEGLYASYMPSRFVDGMEEEASITITWKIS